jgi:trans-aconitate methyltransferase
MSHVEKFDRLASTFSERDYADPARYAARRAQLVVGLGPPLHPGDTLIDLGCGDGNMAAPLIALGLAYHGVDTSPGMLEVARSRNRDASFELAHFEQYRPAQPADCVICLRSIKYAENRAAFFAHVRSYARAKFVFDIDLKAESAEAVVDDVHRAGFREVELRPFFLPQRRRLPAALHPAIFALERTHSLGRLISRRYGILFCAARS